MSWTTEKPTKPGWYAITTELLVHPVLRYLDPPLAYHEKNGIAMAQSCNYSHYHFIGEVGKMEDPQPCNQRRTVLHLLC